MAIDSYKTANEAATFLRVHKNTILDWLNNGKLKGSKIVNSYWLIPDAEIERLIKEGCNTSQETAVVPATATKLTGTQRMENLIS